MMIKFKCFDKKAKKWSKTPLEYQIKDINYYTDYEWCQYLGLHDVDDKELYQGDMIELEITEKLMKTSFRSSILGKYCEKHPEITHIILEFKMQDIISMKYNVYPKMNGKINYKKNGKAEKLTSGEDSNFPQYLIQKGAKYIGNILEQPDLFKRQYIPLKKDIISMYYDSNNYGNFIVLDSDDSIKIQNLENGNILNLSVDECIDLNQRGNLDYSDEADLETYVKDLYLYTNFFKSETEAIKAYETYFELTEEDNDYRKKNQNDTYDTTSKTEMKEDELEYDKEL